MTKQKTYLLEYSMKLHAEGETFSYPTKYVNGVTPNASRAQYIATPNAIGLSSVERPKRSEGSGLTNANGDLVEYYAYSPYGERTAYDSNGTEIDQNSVELKTEYGFTGRRYDMESDLWYFRARYFDTEMGRFVSRDPLGYVDGFGLYNAYFAMLFGLDPSGTHRVRKEYKGMISNCCNNLCLNIPGLSSDNRRRCKNDCMLGRRTECDKPKTKCEVPPQDSEEPDNDDGGGDDNDPNFNEGHCQDMIEEYIRNESGLDPLKPFHGIRIKRYTEIGKGCCTSSGQTRKGAEACVDTIRKMNEVDE